MKLRRLLASVVLLQLLSIAACSGTPDAPVSPSGTASAAMSSGAGAALAGSTSGIEGGAYAFYVGGPDRKMFGQLHTASSTADITSTEKVRDTSVTRRDLILGNRHYRKTVVAGDRDIDPMETSPDPEVRKNAEERRQFHDFVSGKYWKPPTVVSSAVVDGADLADPDAVGLKRLLGRVRSAEGTPPAVTGTLDATGLAKDPTMIGTLARRSPPPATATTLPFRATLDTQGRITALHLTTPHAGMWTIQLHAYGEVQAVKPPAPAEVRKPSAAVAKMLRDSGLPT